MMNRRTYFKKSLCIAGCISTALLAQAAWAQEETDGETMRFRMQQESVAPAEAVISHPAADGAGEMLMQPEGAAPRWMSLTPDALKKEMGRTDIRYSPQEKKLMRNRLRQLRTHRVEVVSTPAPAIQAPAGQTAEGAAANLLNTPPLPVEPAAPAVAPVAPVDAMENQADANQNGITRRKQKREMARKAASEAKSRPTDPALSTRQRIYQKIRKSRAGEE